MTANQIHCVCVVMCGWESLSGGKTRLSSTKRYIWRHCGCALGTMTSVQPCFSEPLQKIVFTVRLWSLKDKASRIERIVGEHRLFSQGLKELQDWLCEAPMVLNTCMSTTTDKSVLEDRMLQLEVRRDRRGVGSLKGICNFRDWAIG